VGTVLAYASEAMIQYCGRSNQRNPRTRYQLSSGYRVVSILSCHMPNAVDVTTELLDEVPLRVFLGNGDQSGATPSEAEFTVLLPVCFQTVSPDDSRTHDRMKEIPTWLLVRLSIQVITLFHLSM
jgi:hypothetical protein